MTALARGSVVVVAGGAGFIGSHLCERLLADGYRVVAVDNLSTGSRDNLAHLPVGEGLTVVDGDIVSTETMAYLDDVVDRNDVSAVLNFASPASPPAYLARPLETLAVGSTGTCNLITYALLCDARFLMASTSEVYGDPLEHPQSERYWGETSTRSVNDRCTTKRSGSQKHSLLHMSVRSASTPALCEFSIHMALACGRTTVVSSPIWCTKHSLVSR